MVLDTALIDQILMNAAPSATDFFTPARVKRVAMQVLYEAPVESIRDALVAEGLTEEEAYLTYMAGKTYAETI